jgi:hypothetical protein
LQSFSFSFSLIYLQINATPEEVQTTWNETKIDKKATLEAAPRKRQYPKGRSSLNVELNQAANL